jgi:putative oxidoreductase
MDIVFLVARILFCFLFLGSAVGHLTKADVMAGYTRSRGVPAAKQAVIGSGLLLLIGALMVLLGLWGDLGSLLLVVFLVPTAVLMHGFWKETDPMAKQMEMVQFNKDIALAGAALAFFVVFRTDPGLTVTGPLFS